MVEMLEVLYAQSGMIVVPDCKMERKRKGDWMGWWHDNVLCGCYCWRGSRCIDRVASSLRKIDSGGRARARTRATGRVAERIAGRGNRNGRFCLDGFLVAECDKLQKRVVGRGRRNVP